MRPEFFDFVMNQNRYSTTDRQEMSITEPVMRTLEDKYLKGETPTEMASRVADNVVKPLRNILDDNEVERVANAFHNLIASRDFIPNSPTLMNAGRPLNQLAACFVVPVEDTMSSIFTAKHDAAMIQRTGGGTGFDFSKLRPAGAKVSTSGGTSSGAISFMKSFNYDTECVKQGGVRKGANMGILRIDHPEIREFIHLKDEEGVMENFNLSVAITDEFMEAVANGEKFDLEFDGEVWETLYAEDLWQELCECAHGRGEPGLFFLDTVNADNPLGTIGYMVCCNPCGEQPLLPNEACNLGSINITHFMDISITHMISKGKKIASKFSVDEEQLGIASKMATLFLDCVIDAGEYPLEKIEKQVKENRKIGLGMMGLAENLIMHNVPYDSSEGRQIASSYMETINNEAIVMSEMLARDLSPFPNYEKSTLETPRRNLYVTTIAPTGTIATIADVEWGIEPIMFLMLSVLDNDTQIERIRTAPVIERYLNEYWAEHPEIIQKANELIAETGSVHGISDIFEKATYLEKVLATAHEIDVIGHVDMQASLQEHVENAISKTINMNNSASVEDVRHVYEYAHSVGVKGITVYRDGSRSSQPITGASKKDKDEAFPDFGEGEVSEIHPIAMKQMGIHTSREAPKRPEKLSGYTQTLETGCGKIFATMNADSEGNLVEVLLRASSSGGCAAWTDTAARLISIMLRYDIPAEVVIDQLRSIRCDSFRYQAGRNKNIRGRSCADVVGRAMEEFIDEQEDRQKSIRVGRQFMDNFVQQKGASGNCSESVGTHIAPSIVPNTNSHDHISNPSSTNISHGIEDRIEVDLDVYHSPEDAQKLFMQTLNRQAKIKAAAEANYSSTKDMTEDEMIKAGICPVCNKELVRAEGCIACQCGWSRC